MEAHDGRELPLFSPINLLFATGAAALLLVSYLWIGGIMFSPGPVSAIGSPGAANAPYTSHAEFENECSLCHQPFKSSQARLCVQCHQAVGEQLAFSNGLHGQLSNATSCRTCHPDHRGRGFSMSQFALREFDHSVTAFPLTGKHTQTECQDCHALGFAQTAPTCQSCHAEPALHAGIFPHECEQCHAPDGWLPALWQGQPFDHQRVGFSLALHGTDYFGQPIQCQSCHSDILLTSSTTILCQNCHAQKDAAFFTGHLEAFGQDCIACHDGVDRMSNFDHASVFPLEGRHAEIECLGCHTPQGFTATQAACVSCHEEPEIHAGSFGLKCEMCHTAQAWQPALLAIHEFPLDHGDQGESACAVCHSGAYTEYTCYNCHEHEETELKSGHLQEGVPVEKFPDCVACHQDGHVQGDE